MKYMLLIFSDPATFDPSQAETVHKEYLEFTTAILASGELVSGEPLQGTDTATTVRVRNDSTTTTDGPFVETKEVLGGYYVVDVENLDRALELAAQIPDARRGGIEVRPVADMADMPGAPG